MAAVTGSRYANEQLQYKRQHMTPVSRKFEKSARAVVLSGDCLETLRTVPEETIDLVVTSPPYNIGKDYEEILPLADYLSFHEKVIEECVRVLKPSGNLCWQVGFSKQAGEMIPLDAVFYPILKRQGLFFRNRIIWTFGHGAHAQKRFSGRHETVLWFGKSPDSYFDLDRARVPQKYPGKRHYKGPKKGQYSGHPLGKNPGDVWDIPNVKAHHPEKTAHQCQFPIGLVQRLVMSLSPADGWVLDPFGGSGSAACGAIIEGRRAVTCEVLEEYVRITESRLKDALDGSLRFRDIDVPIQVPNPFSDVGRREA